MPLLLLAVSIQSNAQNLPAEDQGSPGCIDQYFTKLEMGGPLVPLDPLGNWELAMEPSMVSDRITFFACLPSRPAAGALSGTETPSLFLICGIDVMDAAAIVVSDYRVKNRTEVKMTFDNVEMETNNWKLSMRKKALVAPETTAEFGQKLMTHDQLSVQLTLRNGEVLEFVYDLRDSSESLDVLRQACRWR